MRTNENASTKGLSRACAVAVTLAVTIIALLAANVALAAAGSAGAPFSVIQYVDTDAASGLVLVSAGRSEGVLDGATFKTYRERETMPAFSAKPGEVPVSVETGRLKAVQVKDHYSVAVVIAQSTPLSRVFYPKFPGVMAGDRVAVEKMALLPQQVVTPAASLLYYELFEEPTAAPSNFELTDKGRAALRVAAQAFAGAKVSMLLVEGFTDPNGASENNQIESYQRALTVREFLVSELGFDPARVVAVGLGESEPIGDHETADFTRLNRRIILKAVSGGNESEAPDAL